MMEINMIYPQQQNQQFIHLMSKLSNIQSQNHQPPISHRNEPHTIPIAHSQHPNLIPTGKPQKEWIATYIDGQYFLTDPESMNKLKNIEAQIEQQRNRLAQLQHENTSNNHSFLSYQEEAQQRLSNNSLCDTEFNPSRHFNKQERVKDQLEKQEEMYRQKLKDMEREKLELKKNMKVVDKPQPEVVVVENKPSPSHKRSSHKGEPIQEQSKSKKAEEIKEKSYHKSRIEKSIKDNIVLNQEINPIPQKSVKLHNQLQENVTPAKSVKVEQGQNNLKVEASVKKQVVASSKKEVIGSTKKEPSVKQESHVSKSIHIVVIQPDGHHMELDKESAVKQQPEKSVKEEASPQKSIKAEAKSVKNQLKSVKGEEKSVKVSQKQLNIDNKSVKVEASPSVKDQQKSKKGSQVKIQSKPKTVINEPIQQIQKSIKVPIQKSIKNSNLDKSQKPLQQIQASPSKSQKSQQLHQQLQVQQPKHSERKSIKVSQKVASFEKAPSEKPHSIKVSQKPTPSVKVVQVINQNKSQKQQKVPSQKAPSQKSAILNESPTKSVRRYSVKASSKNKLILNQQPQIAKSIKSKISEPVHHQQQKKSVKSVARSNLQVEEEVKSRKSNIIQEIRSKKSNQIEEQIKSKKSNQIEEQIKSKRSHLNPKEEQIDAKSKKSSQPQPQPQPQPQIIPASHQQQIKSKKHQADIASKKSSHHASVKQQSIVKQAILQNKSVKLDVKEEVLSRRSNKDEILSKKSSFKESPEKSRQIINQHEPIVQKQEQPLGKSEVVSQKHSSRKKSVAPPIQIKEEVKKVSLVDQSIQYSRVTEQQPAANNLHPFQSQSASQKNSSFVIKNNDVSMNESSQLKLQMLQNQLKPQVQDMAPVEYNMKKKKEEVVQNQSEKKSKSFVIHSRQGSVKDRSQKQYQKLNNSKMSSPSRKNKDNSVFNQSSVMNQSVTKEEISKLHEQILLLQEKLKKVQDRQEQLEKLQGTISKIHQNQEVIRKQEQAQQSRVKPQTPMIQNLGELSIAIKPQSKLQIQSSILQVNTTQDIKKKQQKEVEHSEKTKLKEQIGRLKGIIRDMQIQKIKSIDHEGQGDSPTLRPRNFDGKQSRQMDRQSRVQRQSINSYQGQRRFGSNNKRLLEDAGKIMHNTSYLDRPIETPKRRSIQKMKLMASSEDEVVTDPIQLPTNSNNKKNKFYSQVRKSQLVNKLGEKERDFHNFIQSSRVIAEENTNNKNDVVEPLVTPFKNFSRISVAQDNGGSKINYSRMVQQMKKNNPQEQEVLPEIHMRDIKMPNLPPIPNANMTQEELLALAKATYLVFGINVDEEDKQLCVKKYKNCVIFTLNNQNHQCILWHFSGKFYMGGWRTGEPGQGQKDGQGLEYIPDKHVYKGQFLNGKKNGTGILKLSNGNIYDGQWIDGIKNGRGVYLDAATKVIYSGEWRDGKKEGQGFLKLSEKEYYYGTFLKSIKEGFGSQVFVNGDKYKGEYKNGKFHGKGKYLWANSSCYQGQFNQGVRHGQGSWKSAKVNGDIYIGTYDNDKKNGYGRYVWANGCMYQGGFSQDVKHGKGRLTYQDGKQIKGVWEEGNLMSTQAQKPVQHEDQPLRRSVKVTSFGYPSSLKRI